MKCSIVELRTFWILILSKMIVWLHVTWFWSFPRISIDSQFWSTWAKKAEICEIHFFRSSGSKLWINEKSRNSNSIFGRVFCKGSFRGHLRSNYNFKKSVPHRDSSFPISSNTVSEWYPSFPWGIKHFQFDKQNTCKFWFMTGFVFPRNESK